MTCASTEQLPIPQHMSRLVRLWAAQNSRLCYLKHQPPATSSNSPCFKINQLVSHREMLRKNRRWRSMLIKTEMLKRERTQRERLYLWNNINRTNLAHHTIPSLFLNRRRKVQWSQQAMDQTLTQEIRHFKVVPKQLLQDHSGKNDVENPSSVAKEDIL